VGVGDAELGADGLDAAEAQLEPTPSAQAVRIIDWMARLASDIAYGFFSQATMIAPAALAVYPPVRTSEPSLRKASRSRTMTKCQGCALRALALRRPASTMR
jgi:hypothetical protein